MYFFKPLLMLNYQHYLYKSQKAVTILKTQSYKSSLHSKEKGLITTAIVNIIWVTPPESRTKAQKRNESTERESHFNR